MTTHDNIPPDEAEKIDRYLMGAMAPSERADFEALLAASPEMQREVETRKTLINAVEAGAMREKLDEIHNRLQPAAHTSTKHANWWAVAAGIIILLAAGIWALNRNSPEENLFAQYATLDPGLPVPMSASSAYAFHDAMVDYKAEKYDLAISKWKEQLKEYPESDILNYYIGAAYFNQENYREALLWYAEAEKKQEGKYRYKAQWYSVLSLLKLNDRETILATQPLEGSPYADRILEIQQALK